MVLSFLFAYLTLQALWVLIGPAWSFSPLCCLAFAACFPGMIYYYALFPISLLTFLSVLCLILFIRRHYLLAGLVGALCAWAFATGPLIGVVLLASAVLVARGRDFWRVTARVPASPSPGSLPARGLAVVGRGLERVLQDLGEIRRRRCTIRSQRS